MEYRNTSKLTATGFALLALVAHRPASAYELTRQMRQNLRYLWPRAESRLYSEVTRLEEAGLVRGREERVGRRVRRIMAVTPAGRSLLRDWLASQVVPGIPQESEALLRVFFARWGSVDDLRRALTQVRADANDLAELAEDVGETYLANKAIAQQQAHVRAMIHELLSDYALLLARWSDKQLQEISTWKNLSPAGKQGRARKTFDATMKRLASRAKAN